jgi:hypothetical protein
MMVRRTTSPDVGVSGSRPFQISGVAKLNASARDIAGRGVPADFELDSRVAEFPAPRVLIDMREDAASNFEGEGFIDARVKVDALLPIELHAGEFALGCLGCLGVGLSFSMIQSFLWVQGSDE